MSESKVFTEEERAKYIEELERDLREVGLAREEADDERVYKHAELDDMERKIRAKLAEFGVSPPTGDRFGEWALSLGGLSDEGGDVFMTKPPQRLYLLERRDADGQPEGILPLGKVGILAAGGGAGKSSILVQLALTVATGRPWLDEFELGVSTGRALVAMGEEDAAELRRRFYHAGKAIGLDRDGDVADRLRRQANENVHVLALAGRKVQLLEAPGFEPSAQGTFDVAGNELAEDDESAFLAWLRGYLEEHGPFSLVVLDPASRFMGIENENDNAQATRFIEVCESLAQTPGTPTVLVAHHMSQGALRNKNNHQTAARGATAFVDGARWVANMHRAEAPDILEPSGRRLFNGAARLEVVKSNYGPSPIALEILRVASTGAWRVPKAEESERMREAELEVAAERTADEQARKEAAKKRAARVYQMRHGSGDDNSESTTPSSSQSNDGYEHF